MTLSFGTFIIPYDTVFCNRCQYLKVLNTKAKAAVLVKPGHMEIREFDLPFPIIQGDEIAMEIVAIDKEGAKNLSYDGDYLKIGDRITICPDVVCGECWFCKNMPSYPWCEHLQFSYGNMRSCNDVADIHSMSIWSPASARIKYRTVCPMIWPALPRSCA